MLKIKLCLITAAVVGGIFFAIAGKPKPPCEGQPQYYKFGSTYLPAGEFGIDFVCIGGAGNCTYYQANPFNPNSWLPCRVGTISWLYKENRK